MKKTINPYDEIRLQLQKIDRQIQGLDSTLRFISEPELVDSANYQLLALRAKRIFWMNQMRLAYREREASEK